jgi:hypothetical protein
MLLGLLVIVLATFYCIFDADYLLSEEFIDDK